MSSIDIVAQLPLGWMVFLAVTEQACPVDNRPPHKKAPNSVLGESPNQAKKSCFLPHRFLIKPCVYSSTVPVQHFATVSNAVPYGPEPWNAI